MNEKSQRFDLESESALKQLAGAEIHTLLSESCDIAIGESLLEVMSVSIPIFGGRSFIVIESDWADTPKDWLDYHLLSVRVAKAPRGIYYNHNAPKGGVNYRSDHLSIRLGAVARVSSIQILEAFEQGASESVVYDAGLIVTRSDGLRFAIVRAQSIRGSLNVAHAPRDIEQLTQGLAVRWTYAA
ncbi:hypothetical protein [Hylemonella gracilis]|uniref:Uncharacterized protein n=1 Tax=Hylemonella gracilis ATCC 19624 TaxID=887062 RepID=F3KW24_9BURK|nr:hypothetical protein [Hylemonella gracilis]EGI76020.1 hypothetical protein HGR_13309 [Hylemonella gracilis ATCC 19624]